MSAKVDSQNNTTYSVAGSGNFALNDTGGVLAAAKVDVSSTAAAPTLDKTGGNTGKFQVGANANQKIGISIGAVDSETLGTAALDLSKDPDAAIKATPKAP